MTEDRGPRAEAGWIEVVRALRWPLVVLMLGLLATSVGQDITLTASTAVRNEPYGNSPC